MSYPVKSYAAHSPTARLGLFNFERRGPRAEGDRLLRERRRDRQ